MLFHEIPWTIKELAAQSYALAVTIDELKAQLRIDHTDQDDLLADLIAGATEQVEVDTRRAFVSRQFLFVMDQFPYWGQLDRQSIERTSQAVGVFYGGGIFIRRAPLVSVDVFNYVDTTGTLTLLPTDGTDVPSTTNRYVVDTVTEPGRIYPSYGFPWPITRWERNAVQITFTAGYGTTSDSVPRRAKNAIKMLAAAWYRSPESIGSVGDEIALGYSRCINSLRWSAGVL